MNTWKSIEKIRQNGPLVHCITNTVAANFAANAVIAVGGSPVMASDVTESPNYTRIAQALTVNIGTCTPTLVEAIKNCTEVANDRGLPWVLDPVGVAATKSRQDLCADLLNNQAPGVLRGNASEIMAVAIATKVLDPNSGVAGGKGLDSTIEPETVVPAAQLIARKFGCIVAVSGSCDYVIGPHGEAARIVNGDKMMAQVTATGCSLTAVLGCFVSLAHTTSETFEQVVNCITYYSVAGELAARHAEGGKTGTMHAKMLDYLGSMTREEFYSVARPPIDLSMYLVTDPKLNLDRPVTEIVRSAIEGGVTVVQLREKDCSSGEFLQRALDVKAICDRYSVPLIINDRLDIALAVDAAGVHIGQSDLPPETARKLLGPTKIIGLSVSTEEEFEKLKELKDLKIIDYIGVGPVYSTATKKDAKPAMGTAKLEEHLKTTSYLAVAIGGIDQSNAGDVIRTPGVRGIAVVTAITMAEDPTAATQLLKSIYYTK